MCQHTFEVRTTTSQLRPEIGRREKTEFRCYVPSEYFHSGDCGTTSQPYAGNSALSRVGVGCRSAASQLGVPFSSSLVKRFRCDAGRTLLRITTGRSQQGRCRPGTRRRRDLSSRRRLAPGTQLTHLWCSSIFTDHCDTTTRLTDHCRDGHAASSSVFSW